MSDLVGTFGHPAADLAFVLIGMAVAGGPLLACGLYFLKHHRWPAGRRSIPVACYVWSYVVAEFAYRMGFNSPCAFALWLLAGFVLAIWLLATPPVRPPTPPGICPHCQYDLTGNVSGACPECGTPVGPQQVVGHENRLE